MVAQVPAQQRLALGRVAVAHQHQPDVQLLAHYQEAVADARGHVQRRAVMGQRAVGVAVAARVLAQRVEDVGLHPALHVQLPRQGQGLIEAAPRPRAVAMP